MEQILTLKVDLEHPDDARHAINKAVEAYKESKSTGTLLNSTKQKAEHEIFCTACATMVAA